MPKRVVSILMVAAFAIGRVAAAQDATAPAAFEVASVRLNAPGAVAHTHTSIRVLEGGRLNVSAATLAEILQFAFSMEETQITQGPSWLTSDRFDIVAKAVGNPAEAEMRRLLQVLLADRFQLRIHRESRQLPVYALVIAKGGPKLKVSDPGGHPADAHGVWAASSTWGSGHSHISGDYSAAQLARELGKAVGRTVIDQTSLPGTYRVNLEWAPLPGQNAVAGSADYAGDHGHDRGSYSSPESRPSIFTAIQEQLGLKLSPERGPVDVIVIDGVARPSTDR